MLLQLGQEFGIGGGDEDARRAGGMHLRRQGRERVNPFHTEGLGKLDQPVTENVPAHGWLRFADENDEIMLTARIVPDEQPALRQAAGLDQAVFHLDMVDVKQLSRPGTRPAGACPVSPSNNSPR